MPRITGVTESYPLIGLRLLRGGFLAVLFTTLSPTSKYFQPYLGTQISLVAHEDLSIWSHYFSLETSWRLILGDGLMGFYRYNLSVSGTAYMVSFNNGFMEAYDAGGVVYLLFYLLLIFVGFYGFKKRAKNGTRFSLAWSRLYRRLLGPIDLKLRTPLIFFTLSEFCCLVSFLLLHRRRKRRSLGLFLYDKNREYNLGVGYNDRVSS
jgi:hypothetical protein